MNGTLQFIGKKRKCWNWLTIHFQVESFQSGFLCVIYLWNCHFIRNTVQSFIFHSLNFSRRQKLHYILVMHQCACIKKTHRTNNKINNQIKCRLYRIEWKPKCSRQYVGKIWWCIVYRILVWVVIYRCDAQFIFIAFHHDGQTIFGIESMISHLKRVVDGYGGSICSHFIAI